MPEVPGLHHVTAVTGDAAANVAFYTRVLGLRLVKRTVNQDDVTACHLFYGDETGSPGTEVTFFHWPNLPRRVPGTGTVERIALCVPDADALRWWLDRSDRLGVEHGEAEERRGRAVLPFAERLAPCGPKDAGRGGMRSASLRGRPPQGDTPILGDTCGCRPSSNRGGRGSRRRCPPAGAGGGGAIGAAPGARRRPPVGWRDGPSPGAVPGTRVHAPPLDEAEEPPHVRGREP